MRRILAGIETEYGLLVSGRGATDQIDDAKALVRAYPGKCLPIWDYRYESPRADLRGFQQRNLTIDPEDAKFDEGKSRAPDHDIRSDRILPNGARLYNDHGHPEYSTPECFTLRELARHDEAGQWAVLHAARAFARQAGATVSVYKNNTDFHGASYGTHESYLVPRSVGFEALYKGLMPLLLTRQILTGAGKVGSESGAKCHYQLAQRADFFTETANVDTLYRRPIFNTRDEPHADASKWIRLHVISGDANMMPSCTARKVGLMKLALGLIEAGAAPVWNLANPTQAFQGISRDASFSCQVALEGRSWTTGFDILDSYLDGAEAHLELDDELTGVVAESRELVALLRAKDFDATSHSIDWLAKRTMLESIMESESLDWDSPSLASYDLEYTNIDPDEGLYFALFEGSMDEATATSLLTRHTERTRAYARGIATDRFSDQIEAAAWRSITFKSQNNEVLELELLPDMEYPEHLAAVSDVESFIHAIVQHRNQ